MKLDRDLQREILQKLCDAYPEHGGKIWREIEALADEETLMGTLLYLQEHGLLISGVTQILNGQWSVNMGALKITAKGLDFMEGDGGLSAILGVVTVKLHDETLKSLIEAKILASDLPSPDKRRWIDSLRELPAETTKHVVLKLVEMGIENSPTALAAIGRLLGQA